MPSLGIETDAPVNHDILQDTACYAIPQTGPAFGAPTRVTVHSSQYWIY